MDKDTFEQKIQELGKLESVEEMRASLAELSEGVKTVYDANDSLKDANANLTEQHESDAIEMEKIRSANMRLFTQLGSQQTPQQTLQQETGLKQEESQPRRKFEDIINKWA